MKIITSAFLIALLLVSCKKETSLTPTGSSGYSQYGTPVASIPSTEDLVIYEVNLRAFSTAGNLAGVTARLQQLKDLGINTIWLMPIYSEGVINTVHSPYCVKNFKEVSTEYGSLADLRNLTDQAHALNMTVILDWVANHTSWDNPWITAHDDWYTKNSTGQIIKPAGTNWNDVADLNFSNLSMQDAMIDAMKYWTLEANVDGFRCDYADGVPFSFWEKAISSLKALPNRNLLFLAEGTRSDHYTAGFDLTYSWNFYTAIKNCWSGSSAMTLFSTNTNEYATIPSGKHKIRFTTNHDESAWTASPITQYNGVNGALAASIPTIFMYGVPLIYSGQEVGRASTTPFFTKSPINWNANPSMLQSYKDVMAVYNSSDAARKGTVQNFSSTDVVCFKKTKNADQLLVVTNARNAASIYTIPAALEGSQWINALTNENITLSTELNLTAYQFLLLKNQ